MRQRNPLAIIGLVLTLVCAIHASRAADNPPANVDKAADDALRKMGRSLAAAKEFTFSASNTTDQILDNGQKVQIGKELTVRVRRPDAICAIVRGDDEDFDYIYNGTKLAIFNRRANCYALQDVPHAIDAMFDFIAQNFGITAPLSDLMFADPYKTLIERVRSGTYLGLHEVGGVKCHHLAFRQEGIDWQIWIEDSERAVPRKVVITYKEQPAHPQFISVLDKWDLSPAPAPQAFDFAPTSDAKHIDLTPIAPSTQPANQPPSREPTGK